MQHSLLRKCTAALCALLIASSLFPTALAAETPAESNNYFKNDYGTYAGRITSYLYENPGGGLTRVEHIGYDIVVEDYDDNFTLLSSRTISQELPLWGGFYAGEQYNFLISGQQNMQESDSVEVIRVVKYDKDWNRLGQASIYGANTQLPFQAGSLRCAEAGGILYIQTCHQMYKSEDGKNHQSNMRLVIRERDMSVTEVSCRTGTYTGYVSHSFNQHILADHEGNIVTADHGDAYPRSIILYKLFDRAGVEHLEPLYLEDFVYAQTERFAGNSGANNTGAMLGGLAETSSGYLMAYTYDGNTNVMTPRQVYLAYVAKSETADSNASREISLRTAQITGYTNPMTEAALCPTLVPTGLSGGYLLWNSAPTLFWHNKDVERQPNKGLHYAVYSADGSIGPIQTVPDAALSDCQPIVHNGKVVWYTTANSTPVFYTLDGTGVKAIKANSAAAGTAPVSSGAFRDVPASHWAYSSIQQAVKDGITSGYEDGTFRPGGQVTNAHFCAFIARAFYPTEYSTTGASLWYQPYTDVLDRHGILEGTSLGVSFSASINQPISRYDMAQIMYNILVEQGAVMPSQAAMDEARASIGDWDAIPEQYRTAVTTCYAGQILMGQSDGTFGGQSPMNRAQGCVVIARLKAFI